MIATLKAWFTTYALWLLLGALAAVSTFAGVQTLRLAWAQGAVATFERELADARTAAESAARTEELKSIVAAAKAAGQYEKGKADANTIADALLAHLLAGSVRLQPRWQCPSATAVPAAGAAAAEPDAALADRAGSATRIVRSADTCDAQVDGLRALVCADRGLRLVGTECVR